MARLGDVCTVVSGTTPKSNHSGYWDGNLNWVTPAELTDESDTIYETQRKITSQAVIDSSLKSFPAGTVLLSSRAPIGKVAIAGTEMYCNQGFKNLICSEKIYNRYLYHFLKNKTAYLNSLGRGATFKEISKSIVENIEIPLPSLEEQREIAAGLDKVSDLIAKRRQQLEKLDFLVKARFVEMFGDPVSNPKGWMMIPLKECLTGIDNGQSFICSNQSRHYEWPAILKLSAVTYGEYRPDENKALLNISQFIKSAEIHAGDLLFTRKNTPDLVGMAAYVYHSPSNLMMPDLIFRLNTKENCAKIFLWQLINHNLFRSKIQSIASGTAKSMSNISKERLLKLKIYLPPIELQNQFSDFVEQTEKTKTSIKTSLAKLETLKKALMQEYFG